MRRAAQAAAMALVCLLYLANLDGMGLVSKDEPRYADIAREMARTGDWITPRLSGEPWFEKPPLLYWLGALGYKAGLGPELAPRLPVALLSVGFLAFFWRKLRALWDEKTADYATAILATSGGWLAFSHVAVPDLPLAVMFTAAVLFTLERRITSAAAALGFAVMAKSLVPLVLFAPMLALDYRRWQDWVRPAPAIAFLCITVPWHLLCALRNGVVFPRTLFVEHQFGRFSSDALQHQQPWWFYLPVLLLLLFPWFPCLAFLPLKWRETRTRALLATAAAGFLFFSVSVNKLPGYLLPILPLLCALLGIGMAKARWASIAAGFSFALLGLLPLAAAVVPQALAHGLGSTLVETHVTHPWLLAVVAAVPIGVMALRRYAFPVAAFSAGLILLWFEASVRPGIDTAASARSVWLRDEPACVPAGMDRGTRYGLNYYSARSLPECAVLDQSKEHVVR